MPAKKDNTNEATQSPESAVDTTATTANPTDGVAAGESQASGDVPGTGEGGAEPNGNDTPVQGDDTGSNLNDSGNVEPAAGPEDGNQSQPEQGGEPAAGAIPDVNPNTGESDEQRTGRGLDDDVELKTPEEEPVPQEPTSYVFLRYSELWPRINELQKLVDGTGIQLVVDSYQETAKVIIPEYATLPAEFEGLTLAQ